MKVTRILSIAIAILLICLYQSYWLVGEYNELSDRYYEDIQEALRSSDFEEIAHRVNEISKMQYEGRVDVNMGYDHKEKNTIVKSEVSDKKDSLQPHDNQMIVSPESFSSILKNPEDLKKIGLNMQRGIHSAIDGIKEIDLNYLDKILTDKLNALGLNGNHQLLYLQNKSINREIDAYKTDTLGLIGNLDFKPTNIFRLEVSSDAEYVMIIPNWSIVILKKMIPVIVFSAFTLFLLILTFWHLIRTIRKQKLLEEIKTDFTNNITHELKTPIAVAYAANDSLLNFDSAHNTPRMNRYLNVCQQQLRLLDRLVEQILSLSMDRKQSLILNYEEIPVSEMIKSVVTAFDIKYAHDVIFKLDVEENLMLTTDRMHLSNIISNLIDNAIKYSYRNPVVCIKAWRDHKDKIVIEITDNGIGITGEQQKFIFDKFYRVPHGNIHDIKGYGLGLFYVKSMTEKLGGTVRVKSESGKGSSFILIF